MNGEFIRIGNDIAINKKRVCGATISYHEQTNERCLTVYFDNFSWQFSYSNMRFKSLVGNVTLSLKINQLDFEYLLGELGIK